MFSTFPDGWPGAGLLLLRASTGIALIAQGAAYFFDWRDFGLVTLAVALLTVAAGTGLLIGYLTPFAGILTGLIIVVGVLSLLPPPHLDLFEARLTAALAAVNATALVCLGPGAFSIDSRLFGRREIIIPPAPPRF